MSRERRVVSGLNAQSRSDVGIPVWVNLSIFICRCIRGKADHHGEVRLTIKLQQRRDRSHRSIHQSGGCGLFFAVL
jgi:hypothetical protein